MNSGVFMKHLSRQSSENLEKERKDKETRPYVLRPDCPFYGFSVMSGGVMMDSEGNQCALETKSYHPCQMEIIRDKPNWYKCPLNTEENGKKIVENLEQKI